MKVSRPVCPTCGQAAMGTVESVPAVSIFAGDPRQGAVSYGGNYVDWNHQTRVTGESGQPLVACVNGHRWETEILS